MNGAARSKLIALVILGLLSLVCPVLEAGFTGRVEPFGNFALAEAFLSLPPLYWWYHLDKQQRGYRAGPLMNVGVIALTALALPIYFIRSRGWKKGTIAIALAALFLAGTYALSALGGRIGEALANRV